MRRAAIIGAVCTAAVLAAAVTIMIVRGDHAETAALVPVTQAGTSPPTTATAPPATTTTSAPTAQASTTATPLPTSTTEPAPVIDPRCPDSPHGAFVDRLAQRGGLCEHGVVVREFPITTARTQPAARDYDVYAKTLDTSSRIGGHYSTMDHFVAFTNGARTGARIGFHSVPKLANGAYVQPLESVGTAERLGASAGCIRVLPDDAVAIWDWLNVGDDVRVLN